MYTPNSNGIIGDVSRAASPELAYQIGQYFKGTNGEGTAPHILAHGILAAAVSLATGNNVMTGALSGADSEVAAPALANYLYGTKDPSELDQEQKDTIKAQLEDGKDEITTAQNQALLEANEVQRAWEVESGDEV